MFPDMLTDTDKQKQTDKVFNVPLMKLIFFKREGYKNEYGNLVSVSPDIGILQPVSGTSSRKASVQKKTTCTVLLCCVK